MLENTGLIKDLTGAQFGDLTVIGRAGGSASGAVNWECRCACGAVRTLKGFRLRKGYHTSCGNVALAPRRAGEKEVEMRPRDAKTEADLLKLQTDNYPHDPKKFGLLVGEDQVSVHPPSGHPGTYFVIPKKDFNRLVDWYQRDQVERKKR